MGQERIVKKRYTQRHSKFSKSGNRPLCPLCLFSPLASNNSSAQRHSKFSKWGICPMGLMGHIGHQPVEQHSNISKSTKLSIVKQDLNFCHKTQDLPLLGVTMIKRLSAQRYSKNSNGRLSGILCWPHGQDINNSPAQPDSRISEWINCPLSPLCLFSPLAPKNRPAQRHSRIYKLGMCLMELIGHIGLIGITPAVE